MDARADLNIGLEGLALAEDFKLGDTHVSPSRRTVQGPSTMQHLQPKVMLALLCLARGNGRVVTRRTFFETCWPAGGTGDDSLNRTVKALRDAFRSAGSTDLIIETVPRTGYRLIGSITPASPSGRRDALLQEAVDRWRTGLPQPDIPLATEIDDLLRNEGGSAQEWGILALLLRKAVEYAEARDCAKLVSLCERAAREAQHLQPGEGNAAVALAGVKPLFGHWSTSRCALLEILDREPAHTAALHDLAILEMSTGRANAAASIIEGLLACDDLAPTYYYKRMYHLWTLGDLEAAELLAGRALALWPQHPAIWMARFWTLVFTERADEAERMAGNEECSTFLPPPLLNLFKATAAHKARDNPVESDRRGLVTQARDFAINGPAQAVVALLAMCALDAVDEAFQVASGYYLGRGSIAAPLRWTCGDPCITDLHRRASQPLFIPATRHLRQDSRFKTLCNDIGLRAYWNRFGLLPDFANEDRRKSG
jgi:DNA-binding winged helix-turn-helix (wHTH) protein